MLGRWAIYLSTLIVLVDLVEEILNTAQDALLWPQGALQTTFSLEWDAHNELVRFLGVPPELDAAAPAAERNGVRAVIESVLPVSARLPGLHIETMGDLESWPIEAIHPPTLIIAAADDLYNTLPGARHMAERLPGARLVVFETGGHLLVGRQDEVREAVADFLSAAGAQLVPEVAAHKSALPVSSPRQDPTQSWSSNPPRSRSS